MATVQRVDAPRRASGSAASACMMAHATSAWPVMALRVAA